MVACKGCGWLSLFAMRKPRVEWSEGSVTDLAQSCWSDQHWRPGAVITDDIAHNHQQELLHWLAKYRPERWYFKFETETKISSERFSWLELWVFIFFHKNNIFQSPWSRESVCWSLTGWHEHVSGLLGVQRTRMGSWQDILRVQPIINIILTSWSFTHQSLDTL